MILQSDRHWKTFHAWMVNNGVDSRSKAHEMMAYISKPKLKKDTGNCRTTCKKKIYMITYMWWRKVTWKWSWGDSQGIEINSVHNMTPMRAPRNVLPLCLVKVKRGQDKVYKITRCLDLVVRLEKQSERSIPGQCYRCSGVGHSQAYCKMQLRYVRCGDEHRAADCKRAEKVPQSCKVQRMHSRTQAKKAPIVT